MLRSVDLCCFIYSTTLMTIKPAPTYNTVKPWISSTWPSQCSSLLRVFSRFLRSDQRLAVGVLDTHKYYVVRVVMAGVVTLYVSRVYNHMMTTC